MVKPLFGGIIGLFVGILIGCIINAFLIDQAVIEQIERISDTSFILLIGFAGFVAGLIISYIFKKE